MNAFIEGLLGAGDTWLLLGGFAMFAAIVWKMPKHKGKRAMRNPAKNAGKDMLAQATGTPLPGTGAAAFRSWENRSRF